MNWGCGPPPNSHTCQLGGLSLFRSSHFHLYNWTDCQVIVRWNGAVTDQRDDHFSYKKCVAPLCAGHWYSDKGTQFLPWGSITLWNSNQAGIARCHPPCSFFFLPPPSLFLHPSLLYGQQSKINARKKTNKQESGVLGTLEPSYFSHLTLMSPTLFSTASPALRGW